jgi:hypothetical protein
MRRCQRQLTASRALGVQDDGRPADVTHIVDLQHDAVHVQDQAAGYR